jgi:hypothetical protein
VEHLNSGDESAIPSAAKTDVGDGRWRLTSLMPALSAPRGLAKWVIAAWVMVLGWAGVGWAFQKGTVLIQDELGNLAWQMHVFWPTSIRLLPQIAYNDRPAGFILEGFLYSVFGMNYRPQLACFLVLHFANAALCRFLFRRLKVPALLCAAGVGVLCTLATTAQTATYLGASFDVLCTLFLLCSTLAVLRHSPIMWYVSALAYLFALRSKEFALAFPFVLLVLIVGENLKTLPLRGALAEAARRLWLHFLILGVFAYTYFSLLRKFVPEQPSASTYHMALEPRNIVDALAYYSTLIVGMERFAGSLIPLFALGIALCYAAFRKHVALLFSLGAYMVTLLPVCLLPNIRAPFYVYCPQIFYVLSICIILSDAVEYFVKSPRDRRLVVLGVSVLLLSGASAFRTSQYFRDRVHFYWMVRESCTVSARDVRQQLGKVGSGSHIYVSSGEEVPWFFSTTVACDGVKLLRHDQSIDCIARKPEAELLRLYADDPAEKYFVDYAPGGYLTTRMRGGARTGESGR